MLWKISPELYHKKDSACSANKSDRSGVVQEQANSDRVHPVSQTSPAKNEFQGIAIFTVHMI